ncbi:unnamed protein product [Cercospora beticola]|nr:unnamed protein product [Cercospora beticola]
MGLFPSTSWTKLLTMDFDDQFGSDLISYIMLTKDVGGTRAALPGKIKMTYREEILTAFYNYSREVYNRLSSPFILTQGSLWHDWLHTDHENI